MRNKVFIEYAGCNRRHLDLNTIATYLKSNDYELVDRPEDADTILVATCAFKKVEEDASVQRLRYFRKYNSKMIVYGCFPDIAKRRFTKEFADIPKVAPREIEKIENFFPGNMKKYSEIANSNLIGNQDGSVIKAIARTIQTRPTIDREFWHRMIVTGRKKLTDIIHPPVNPYYLFVCRGCMGKCTYCAIRNAIGTLSSKPIATVVSEFQRGMTDGYRDFIILGDDPGCYGIDLGSSLPELLKALFAATDNVEKSKSSVSNANREIAFHINEIHPKFFIPYADEFITMERFSFVRSILCPIQSGSNRILELMHREHTADQFEEAVKKIHARQPHVSFNSQIIIGYPSETEEDFQNTLDCVVRCNFNYVVIFPYDDKDGTESSLQSNKIPANIIDKRMRKAFQHFAKRGVTAYYKCP